MGKFKIEITAVGGHGVERHKEVGETINFDAEGDWTPDSIAKQVAQVAKGEFARRGIFLESAELIHWPGEPGEVRDNLLTGVRTAGSFNRVAVAEVAEAVEEEIALPDLGETPLIEEPLADAGVPAVATNEVVAGPEDFGNR